MSKANKRTWQKLEQRVCAKFGGRRTPLSGSNSQHGTSADCIETNYPWLYEEVMIRYLDVNGYPNSLCKVSKSEEEAREWFEREHPQCKIVEVRWRGK